MTEENNSKRKKSTKYLLIGTLVLFLSVLGASVAYYLARVSGNLSGRAAGTELAINVEKLSSSATGDLIPLDNDLETLNLAAAGYQDKGACVDINGYSVCQIYHITLTNNGSVPLTVNGTVTLSGQNVPNIDCAKMDDEDTITNNASCMSGMFVQGDTLAANSHNDYYVMVYIKNLDEPQTDSGEFNGTVTFTSEDGKKIKGRFTKPFNLVQHITNLYSNAEKSVINVRIEDCLQMYGDSCKVPGKLVANDSYNYATSVGLMNDRLGGTASSLDGGNIRYYGAEPNNYIDIGDKTEVTMTKRNWEEIFELNGEVPTFNDSEGCKNWVENEMNGWNNEAATATGYSTLEEFCAVKEIPAGTPILWRIIGVFDEKLRIRRDEAIRGYSFDSSASSVNDGYGINEWSQADLMKLLNPGYENNVDKDSEGNNVTVNNSLWWNSESGKCYNGLGYANIACDFTNSGLSDEAKEYVVDQTIYLGGFNTNKVAVNQAYEFERESNVIQNPSDGIARTTRWAGKVGLIYPSDFGYAADLSNSNCQKTLNSFDSCTENWMKGVSWTVSPNIEFPFYEMVVAGNKFNRTGSTTESSIVGTWPTLLLDSTALAESGNGSKETPYVVAY